MKLYSYSSESLTFVEAKWVKLKFIFGVILAVTVILCGVFTMNLSVADPSETRTAKALSEENDLLRQQLDLMYPRVNKLELLAGQLQNRADQFHRLLLRRSAGDSISRLKKALTIGSLPIVGVQQEPASPQRSVMNYRSMPEGSRNDSMVANRK